MSTEPLARLRRAISPLELFFDLVFVFAVGQLAAHLHEELSWRGAAETAVMLVAVMSTWALTSFDATFLDIERLRTRQLVLVVMALGLFMNAQIPHAFDDRPWAFAVPLVAIVLLTDITAAVSAPTAVAAGARSVTDVPVTESTAGVRIASGVGRRAWRERVGLCPGHSPGLGTLLPDRTPRRVAAGVTIVK
ncbi:low temperature requirement protein A [Streptomyces albus]|uniref:low temperature requirement protein A n=1 Tax=Streptomyces albus TaxID=1888 RepID=UPI0033DBCC6B